MSAADSVLIHPSIERALVAALVAHPELLASMPADLDLEALGDPQARAVYAALRNLEAAEVPIDALAVRALIRLSLVEREAPDADLSWLDAVLVRQAPGDTATVMHWAETVIQMRERRRAVVEDHEARGRAEDEVTDIALRDAEPAQVRRVGRRLPDLVDSILAQARLPWIELALAAGDEPLVRGRVGSYALLIGWEGSGKSSLVLQLGAVAARAGHAFCYLSTELDAEEAGARTIGILVGESWEDVQRGRVGEARMREAADLSGYVVLTGEHGTLRALERCVAELRAERPDRQVVVAVDYLQDLELPEKDLRQQARAASRAVRQLAKRLGVLALGVSQTSRQGRGELRGPDTLGAATTTTGAESAQLERDAYVQLALGNPREREDGSGITDLDLNVGKSRMGQGDMVWPVSYHGRTGRWSSRGSPRRASAVRADRMAERSDGAVDVAVRLLEALLATAVEPLSARALREQSCLGRDVTLAAVARMIKDGTAVRVKGKKLGGSWPLVHAKFVSKYEVVPEGVS